MGQVLYVECSSNSSALAIVLSIADIIVYFMFSEFLKHAVLCSDFPIMF